MVFHIITIFPHIFDSYLKESILGRAIKNKKIKVKFFNPRDYTKDKHKTVDDKPYGGGPGMALKALPVVKATSKALSKLKVKSEKFKVIILSPSGKKFTNTYARTLANKYSDIVLISGRYEGIDARVKKILYSEYGARRVEEISIGDYILSGGEVPAMVVIEAISRQIPNVLGKKESLEEERIATSEVYTRPEVIEYKDKNYKVPKVLLSGHHAEIEAWRKNKK